MDSPCICTNLRAASRKLTATYDAALAPLGINIAQYFLLRTIANHREVSLTDLARLAELERSTIGRNIQVIERMGYVEATRSASDQREIVLALTRSGRQLMRKALPIWEDCQQAFIARFGPEKAEVLNAALQSL